MTENVWNSLKFFWHCGQNCILCVQKRFLKNFFCHKVFKFFSFFKTLSRTFSTFGENNLIGLSKLFSIVQGRFLGRIVFWKQILWNVSFFGLWAKSFGLSAKTFQQVRQNCFVCVPRRFLIGLFFYEFFECPFCLWAVRKTFCNNYARVLESFSELKSKWTRNFRGKFVFCRKIILLQFFPVLVNTSADFCRKAFRPVWKTAFYTHSRDLLA